MAGRHVSASLTKPLLGPSRRTNPQVKKGLLRNHTHLLSGRCKRMHEVPMRAWRQNIPDFGIFQAILSLQTSCDCKSIDRGPSAEVIPAKTAVTLFDQVLPTVWC